VWYDFGAGSTVDAIAKQDYGATHLADNNNVIADPMLNGISRNPNGGLDPRPGMMGPAYENLADIDEDGFFTTVTYKGAFGATNWATGWTALFDYGFFAREQFTDVETDEELDASVPAEYALHQNYPNPFNPSTNIRFELPTAGNVTLVVYNQLGQQLDILVNGYKAAGQYQVTWDATNQPSGVYFYKLQTADAVQIRKMMLIK
jgi:hypothetical protein